MYHLANSTAGADGQPLESTDSMPGQTTPTPSTDRDESDTWPWACVDCRTTIYHDGAFCRACESAYRSRETNWESDTSDGFVDWMRDQTASVLVLKVTAVAGIELALTAFWLQTLLRGSVALAGVVPIAP